MSSIDNRVVSMQFDNASFEHRLGETIQSLDKLRASLDFASSRKGLEDLGQASKSINMNELGTSIDSISAKFLALATVGITVLSQLVTKAIEAGAAFVKSFSFGPVLDGFHEFETNMNSIQTILANTDSKGTTLNDVNAALNQLNEYSDKTIYNFAQMARNIGTFTAAGVDLDTSVGAIKGIANLAAISGSNAEQASTAMYQLSQALAGGKVRLQDWISVRNAGMGGEVFQKALFETGKALGTIKNANIDTTFEQWTSAGHSFQSSLEEDWLTSKVLTQTLQGFTGDLNEAQLMTLGYTQKQADEFVRLGKIGIGAAQDVKTFTQLVGTVKEAIGTGWADTFRLIIGGFDESKSVFTDLSNSIGAVVKASADSRNEVLKTWHDFGARDALIGAFKDVGAAIKAIITPIHDAFRDIFPKKTGEDLIRMTASFVDFAKHLKIGAETSEKLKSTFQGVFSIFSIGIEVVKGIAFFIKELVKELAPAGSMFLNATAASGSFLTKLQETLVSGGKIHAFFEKLVEVVKAPIEFLGQLKDKIVDLFTSVDPNAEGTVGRMDQRFTQIKDASEALGGALDRLKDGFHRVMDVLDKAWEAIKNWFGDLGNKLAAAFHPGDFDNAVDIINVGLLGGIALMLKKFLSGGIDLDFGDGIVKKMDKIVQGITDTMKAMQTQLKADALLKIAKAIGLLVISITVLSLIDSAALTKALTALSVGFGELIGAMTLLDRINFTTGIPKLAALATAMVIIATAAAVLTIAIARLSKIDLGDLAKGLAGVGLSVGILIAATHLISTDAEGLIATGIAMNAIATSLVILAAAVKLFATMEWGDLGKGLAGIAGGLAAVTLALNFMPPSSAIGGLGFIEVAIGLNVLFGAVKLFSTFDWGEMGKGLAGIAGALLIVVTAMNLMPIGAVLTGPALIAIAIALGIMAESVKILGDLDFGTLAKGIGGFAVMLGVLVLATNAMDGALPGAAALVVVGGALFIFGSVIKKLGEMDFGTLAQGIGAIAVTLGILGVAAALMTPVIPMLLALGAAIGLLGIGFAAFGVGAILVAKSFEVMGKSGAIGAQGILDALKVLVKAIPEILSAVVIAIIQFLNDLLDAVPLFLRLLEGALVQLFQSLTKLAPELGKALIALITEGLRVIRETYPDFVKTGFEMLMAILHGIKDNIKEIAQTVADIITNFLDALSEKMPQIVDAVYNFITSVIKAVLLKFVGVELGFYEWGVSVIIDFFEGLASKIGDIGSWFMELPGKIGEWLGDLIPTLPQKGIDILTGLLNGLEEKAPEIAAWMIALPPKILGWIGDIGATLLSKGWEALTGLITGLEQKAPEVAAWFISLPPKILGWIGDISGKLLQKGVDTIGGFLYGVVSKAGELFMWFSGLPYELIRRLGDIGGDFLSMGSDIISGIIHGIQSLAPTLLDKVKEIAASMGHMLTHPWEIFSPSKKAMRIGRDILRGLIIGLDRTSGGVMRSMSNISDVIENGIDPEMLHGNLNKTFNEIVSQLDDLANMDIDSSPVITPVLDLTKIQAASKDITTLMGNQSISAEVSLQQAKVISTTSELAKTSTDTASTQTPTEVSFTQINNSPDALRTSDIYRNTKSQFALAKEELGIS